MPFLKGRRGRLHARTWHGVAPVLAQVVLLHGFGEDLTRFEPIVPRLTRAGIETHALDLPGHGRSHGDPALPRDVEKLADDAGLLLRSVQRLYPGTRTVLAGQSLGALVAFLLAGRLEAEPGARPAGLLLCAAPLTPVPLPGIRTPERGWRASSELLAAGGPRIPIRLLHGGRDELVPIGTARAHAAQLASARLVEFPEARHDVLSGPDQDRYVDQLIDVALGRGLPTPPRGLATPSRGPSAARRDLPVLSPGRG